MHVKKRYIKFTDGHTYVPVIKAITSCSIFRMSGRSSGFRKASINLGSGSSTIIGINCGRSSIGGEEAQCLETTTSGLGESPIGTDTVVWLVHLTLPRGLFWSNCFTSGTWSFMDCFPPRSSLPSRIISPILHTNLFKSSSFWVLSFLLLCV
ncbi:hypothetical protein L211DRAFT_373705 [Terfezia boudieri ATCC MYA-4762]|uniref:Uncharacterized protein n=1 Tax=Terfezia boudieri ATCC MYA-4762 TaxID=1051890 RepID=A0A3N4LZR4_9PEZI|nr:hypothetical protein L211DRAFT_373705 [Terfezia boudieri ATCC MYA-4762]